MRTIDIHEATDTLFWLVERAAGSKSFLIATSGTPRVMVLPLDSKQATPWRRVGLRERCLIVAEELDSIDAADRVDGRKIERARSASVAAIQSVTSLKGMFGEPIKTVSIDAMNPALALRAVPAA